MGNKALCKRISACDTEASLLRTTARVFACASLQWYALGTRVLALSFIDLFGQPHSRQSFTGGMLKHPSLSSVQECVLWSNARESSDSIILNQEQQSGVTVMHNSHLHAFVLPKFLWKRTSNYLFVKFSVMVHIWRVIMAVSAWQE